MSNASASPELLEILKKAIEKDGIPKRVYVDTGKATPDFPAPPQPKNQ